MVTAASVPLCRGGPEPPRAAAARPPRAQLHRLRARHPRDAWPRLRRPWPGRARGRPGARDDLRPGPVGRGGVRPPDGRPAPDLADTEASLLARAQAGDVAAFERLSGRYADRLFMLLLRLLGDRAEAEDVAQEVMLRAWQGITRFRGQSSYFTWLYRIAVNEANRDRKRVV